MTVTQLNEMDIRRSLQRALSALGMAYYHPPDVNVLGDGVKKDGNDKTPPSRPDTIALYNAPPIVFEVKRVDVWTHAIGSWKGKLQGSFRLAEIRDNQRTLMDSLYNISVPVFIVLGNVPRRKPNERREILKPEQKKIFVIPWGTWIVYETGDTARTSFMWTEILEKFSFHEIGKNEAGEYAFNENSSFLRYMPPVEKKFEFVEISRRFEDASSEVSVSDE